MAVHAQSQPAAGSDQVVIGAITEPDILNELFSLMVISGSVLTTLFTVDIQRDNGWRTFAQGVESLPNIKDGTWKVDGERMTLFWKIKPRTWHDGRPVTCSDYVFTHTVARNELMPIPHNREMTKSIASVSCPQGAGGREVVVTWKSRDPVANWHVIEFGVLPRHVLEPFYRRNPSTLNLAPYGQDPTVTIGDGAYRLIEWRKGESITVESVGTHPVLGKPKIRKITWRFFPDDPNALMKALLSGSIDAISTTAITFDQALQLEAQAAGRVRVVFPPGLVWEHIDFNLDNPLLQDVRVRRAIAYGINRKDIVQRLFQGRQPVSHTYLPPRHPAYTDKVPKYAYDPTRAQALLQDVGFSPGPDGIRRNAAGQRFSLELNTTAGNRIREQAEQMIQQQLREIGIEISIVNYPPRVFFSDFLPRRRFKAMSMYAFVLSPTADCEGLYTSNGIPSENNGWAGENGPGYRNVEFDQICQQARRELDEGKRIKLLQQSQIIFSRDLPALPLFIRSQPAAAKVGLRNFAPIQAGGASETWNAHLWYWK